MRSFISLFYTCVKSNYHLIHDVKWENIRQETVRDMETEVEKVTQNYITIKRVMKDDNDDDSVIV